MTTKKPTYEELEQKVRKLEKQFAERSQVSHEQLIRLKYMESVFHNGPVAIVTLDRDHRIVDWNPGAQEIFGYSKDEALDRDLDDLVSGPDVDHEARANTAKVLDGQTLRPVEAVRYCKSGFPIHVLASAVPIFMEGELKGLVAMYADISQRKHAEEALLEKEEKYRALYDNAPLSYQSLDEEGNFLDVNPMWLRTLGYNRNEVIGRNFGEFLHPEWKGHFAVNFPEFKRRGFVHDVQFKIRHKDGHYLDISFEGCIGYHPDGSFRQTYCVFKDITEQKQAEHALRESEKRYRSLFEESNDAIFLHTLDGKVLDVNPRGAQMLGTIKSHVLNMRVQDFHPYDEMPMCLEALKNTSKMGSAYFESRFRRMDGSILDVEISSRVVDSSQGVVQGIVRDITERKRVEEKFRLHSLILNQIEDRVTVTDLDGFIVYINDAE